MEEVERVESLELEHRDLMNFGFKTHYADRAPKKLEEEQSRYFAKLRRAEKEQGSGMPLDVLLRFPGFVNYGKGPVS